MKFKKVTPEIAEQPLKAVLGHQGIYLRCTEGLAAKIGSDCVYITSDGTVEKGYQKFDSPSSANKLVRAGETIEITF